MAEIMANVDMTKSYYYTHYLCDIVCNNSDREQKKVEGAERE